VATCRRLFSLSVVFSALACAADPTLINLLIPNARVLFGVNVARIAASPMGKELGAQLQSVPPEVRRVLEQTGFDPTRDLDEILIAATSDTKNGPALVLARGRFDAAKIASFTASEKPYTFEGVQILNNPAKDSGAIAILDNNIAIGGDLDQVKAAIRRRNHASTLDPVLAAKVTSLSERYDVWVVSATNMAGVASSLSDPNLKQMGDMLKSIQQISGGVKLGSDVEVAAELVTHTVKDAAHMADSLRMLTSLITMNQQGPSAIRPDDLKLTVEANTVRIAIRIKEAELKKAYQMQMAHSGFRASPPAAMAAEKPRPPVQLGLVIQSSERDMGTVVVPPAKQD